jgi:uncharacterized protein YceK
MKILLPFLVVLLAGCSTFHSEQTQSPDGTTKTIVQLRSFWDSRSELAKLKTTLTDKNQGVSIGAINQETTASNIVVLLQAIAAGAAEGAVRGVK